MIQVKRNPHPFLKWAGGKTKLIPHIVPLIDKDKFNYYEPFLGGGALYFHLHKTGRIKKAFLNDINAELINVYSVIKTNIEDFLLELKNPIYKNDRDCYLMVRSKDLKSLDEVQRAARLYFLNRTCFNGLYRVNKSNQFNVPFGKYDREFRADEDNLREVSNSLKIAELSSVDYNIFLKRVRKQSVVYIDPPYIPIKKDSFTEYTGDGFSIENHKSLSEKFNDLGRKGHCCILSNSGSEISMNLYKDHQINKLMGHRNIGGSPDSREQVMEILVKYSV